MKKPGIKPVKSNSSFAKRIFKKLVKARPAVQQEGKKRMTDYFSANYEKINCCSVHLPIDGRMDMIFDTDPGTIRRISIPIRSLFLATCIKEGKDNYRLTWSCSMS